MAAHKFEGPSGAGLLWLRRGTAILPQVHGGTQERYRRAGTEDVAAAVGMATAYELACAGACRDRGTPAAPARSLRDALTQLPDVEVTGHPRSRLPGLLSLVIRGVEGDALVQALDLEGICCSTGSACTTGRWSRATSSRRWASPTRRRGEHCGFRSGGRRPTPSRTGSRGHSEHDRATARRCRDACDGATLGSNSLDVRPERDRGGAGLSETRPRGHVGRRRFVGCGRAPELRGGGHDRRLDASPRRCRLVQRVQEELLLARCRG